MSADISYSEGANAFSYRVAELTVYPVNAAELLLRIDSGVEYITFIE